LSGGVSIVKAGVVYFLLVFAAGWVCGPLRELVVVPRFGRTTGLLVEAPLMLIAMVFAARWTLRRFAVPAAIAARAAVGLIALALLLLVEAASLPLVRGVSVADYIAGHDLAAGLITLILFALFAAMPALVPRR
jgi:hypothetical protein